MNLRSLLSLPCLLLVLATAAAEDKSLDRILVIIDDSVITERDLENRVDLVKVDFNRSNRRLPSENVLNRQVLNTLITDAVLMQEAKRRGITITDGQLNQAMQGLARQNNRSLAELRKSLIAEGLDYEKYRETVRLELTISTLNRQYGQRNATISELEVDEFIRLSGADAEDNEYRLSHILISVPDAATPKQVSEAQQLAEELLAKLRQGEKFDELANEYSSGGTALQGGDLGWRKKAEIPSLFTEQVLGMSTGDFAGPIRSASGFHIVYLNETRSQEKALSKQTRSRHILVKSNELVTEVDAQNRLLEFRDRVEAGEDFARLARLYSVDYSSGVEGGDIGWINPGETVREYQDAADQLEIDEISQPVRSQFGWHLIQVTGRREVDETEQNKRNRIYSQLLQQKQREVFDLWKRRLRDEAYVVFPGQPKEDPPETGQPEMKETDA